MKPDALRPVFSIIPEHVFKVYENYSSVMPKALKNLDLANDRLL